MAVTKFVITRKDSAVAHEVAGLLHHRGWTSTHHRWDTVPKLVTNICHDLSPYMSMGVQQYVLVLKPETHEVCYTSNDLEALPIAELLTILKPTNNEL